MLGPASLSLLPQSTRGQSLKLPSCLPLVSDGFAVGGGVSRWEVSCGSSSSSSGKLRGHNGRWCESPVWDTCSPQGFLSLSIKETLPMSWTLEKTTGSTSSSSHAPCLFDLIFQLIVWRLKVSTELDREEKRQRVYMGECSMLRRHLSGWAKCLRSRKTLWKVGTWCFWQGQALFGARWNSWVSWIHTRNWVKIKSHSGYQTCRGYRETHLGHFKTPLRVLYKCSFIYST